jgi:hypothetical protein
LRYRDNEIVDSCLRIPGHADQHFWRMPITNSGACRSRILAMPIKVAAEISDLTGDDAG